MTKRFIILLIILTLTVQVLFSLDIDITPEELTTFMVTPYTEKEQLPLDGLLSPEGVPFAADFLKGKYILINIGATWCPYCRGEKPSFQRLYNEHANEYFTVLAVFVGERPDTVKNYMDENDYSFPVAVEPENKLRASHAPRIPTSYLIGPDRNIIARLNDSRE
jgi:thiol-disulfide isomerase/thioredoxin